jgi:hypothetical protein
LIVDYFKFVFNQFIELIFNQDVDIEISPLANDKNCIHPNIISKKMEKSLEIYYSNYKNS